MHKKAFAVEKRIARMSVSERPRTVRRMTATFGQMDMRPRSCSRSRI